MEYGAKMTCRFHKCCFISMISVFLVLGFTGAAEAESGFHAQSRDLPATSSSGGRDCSGLIRSGEITQGEYTSGRTVTPADIEPVGSKAYPIVRFDLGLGNRRKNRYISPGLKNNRLRARDLSVGEVSVDTFNGSVALDGQPLTRSKNRTGC